MHVNNYVGGAYENSVLSAQTLCKLKKIVLKYKIY